MAKTRVPVAGTIGKSIRTTDTSTQIAALETAVAAINAFLTAQQRTAAQANPSGLSPTAWNLIMGIPPDVLNRVPGRDGDQGDEGPRGPPGDKGERGFIGGQGPPGNDGIQGEDGPPGPKGEQGPTGPTGPAGSSATANPVVWFPEEPEPPMQLPPFDQGASPTWGGAHVFARAFTASGLSGDPALRLMSSNPAIMFDHSSQAADNRLWIMGGISGTSFLFRLDSDSGGTQKAAFQLDRSGAALSNISYGNATDAATFQFLGGGLTTFSGNVTLNPASGACILTLGANATDARIGVAAAAGNIITGSVAHDLCMAATANPRILFSADSGTTIHLRLNASSHTYDSALHRFNISGAEAITINGAVTTGTSTPSMAAIANKPGATTGNQIAKWLPVTFGGTQYYIPMWVA